MEVEKNLKWLKLCFMKMLVKGKECIFADQIEKARR